MTNNWFDITIIIVIIIAIISGFRTGIIMQLTGLIALILGIVFTGRVASSICPFILKLTDFDPQIISIISYIISFLAIVLVVSLIGRAIHKVMKYASLGIMNRIAGSLFSICTLLIICSIILNIVLYFDHDSYLIKEDVKKNSFFFKPIKQIVPTLSPHIKSINIDDINKANFVSL